MTHTRIIKPEFFTDERIRRLSPSEKLLLIGMCSFADSNGVGQADPTLLQSAIFPKDGPSATDEMVKEWTAFIAKLRLIRLFRRRGEVLYYVTNWGKHIGVGRGRPAKSRFQVPERFLCPRGLGGKGLFK